MDEYEHFRIRQTRIPDMRRIRAALHLKTTNRSDSLCPESLQHCNTILSLQKDDAHHILQHVTLSC